MKIIGVQNDEQDKLNNQSEHIGSIDLPIGGCEAVAGKGISRSKHHDSITRRTDVG